MSEYFINLPLIAPQIEDIYAQIRVNYTFLNSFTVKTSYLFLKKEKNILLCFPLYMVPSLEKDN